MDDDGVVKLARMRSGPTASAHIGVVLGDEVADLTAGDPKLPDDVLALLDRGPEIAALVRSAPRVALESVELLAPIPLPPSYLAIGLNYAAHCAEGGRDVPTFPVFFPKQRTCVNGPNAPVHLPRASERVDYEGELGVVIGRRCRHVPAARAMEVVAGFMVLDDVSVRDWQARSPTIMLGKSWDTHGPTGPWLTTRDEAGDPMDLRIRTWVNGDLRQNSSTNDMVFDIAAQIETLSTVCTLEAGTILATGTPSGVGMSRNPPEFLRAGDRVRIEIDGLGTIDNPFIAEPADTPLL